MRCPRPSIELFLEDSFLIRGQTDDPGIGSSVGILRRGWFQHFAYEQKCTVISGWLQRSRRQLVLRGGKNRDNYRDKRRCESAPIYRSSIYSLLRITNTLIHRKSTRTDLPVNWLSLHNMRLALSLACNLYD